MKYTQKILNHPEFIKVQKEITEWERDRIYCHHEMSHAVDVCRMAWIMYLEWYTGLTDGCEKVPEQRALEEIKDRIYVAGLLHDIGRARQYETGEHHSVAGGVIASRIMEDIDYPCEWRDECFRIVTAHHGRTECESKPGEIAYYIQRADHLSRNCFCCEAVETCKWKMEERNSSIEY